MHVETQLGRWRGNKPTLYSCFVFNSFFLKIQDSGGFIIIFPLMVEILTKEMVEIIYLWELFWISKWLGEKVLLPYYQYAVCSEKNFFFFLNKCL